MNVSVAIPAAIMAARISIIQTATRLMLENNSTGTPQEKLQRALTSAVQPYLQGDDLFEAVTLAAQLHEDWFGPQQVRRSYVPPPLPHQPQRHPPRQPPAPQPGTPRKKREIPPGLQLGRYYAGKGRKPRFTSGVESSLPPGDRQ